MRYVVRRSPGADVTAWLNLRRTPGDVVVDLDELAAAVFRIPQLAPPAVVQAVTMMRGALFEWAKRSAFASVVQWFVVVDDDVEAVELARTLRAELVRLEGHRAAELDGGEPGGP